MWNLIVELWNTVIFEPIFNLITILIAVIPGHNFGVALIIFTVVMRFLFYPLIKKQLLQTRLQKELQPEVVKIKQANKGNRQRESLEIMALYKERGFNPFAILGYILLQFPVLIGLYQVISRLAQDTNNFFEHSYSFIQNWTWMQDLKMDLSIFDASFLGMVDLTRAAISENGLYLAAFIVVLATVWMQYLSIKQTIAYSTKGSKPKKFRQLLQDQAEGKEVDKSEFSAASQRLMVYIMPALVFFIALGWFAALPFYWLVSNIMQYFQQKHINQKIDSETPKATVDGQAVAGDFQKSPNAKQKKQSRQSVFEQALKQPRRAQAKRKRVGATTKTVKPKHKLQSKKE